MACAFGIFQTSPWVFRSSRSCVGSNSPTSKDADAKWDVPCSGSLRMWHRQKRMKRVKKCKDHRVETWCVKKVFLDKTRVWITSYSICLMTPDEGKVSVQAMQTMRAAARLGGHLINCVGLNQRPASVRTEPNLSKGLTCKKWRKSIEEIRKEKKQIRND